MRRPSDRAELWRRWRERLAGVRRRAWSPDEIECGRYMAKRGGQWQAVQIDIAREIDSETGELLGDERFVAWVGVDKFEEFERVVDIWARCGSRPVSDEEYKRLLHMPAITSLTTNVVT